MTIETSTKVWAFHNSNSDEKAELDNIDDLWDHLDNFRKRYSNSVGILIAPDGQHLNLGRSNVMNDYTVLPQELGYVEHCPADGNPPYLAPVEDPSISIGDGILVFRYADELSEIPRRYCVELSKMKEIVRHFMATNRLPDWIMWEQI
jgi:hypothetical protein